MSSTPVRIPSLASTVSLSGKKKRMGSKGGHGGHGSPTSVHEYEEKVIKAHSLWKQAESELSEARATINELRSNSLHEFQELEMRYKTENARLNLLVKELGDRLGYAEQQLLKLKEEKELIAESLEFVSQQYLEEKKHTDDAHAKHLSMKKNYEFVSEQLSKVQEEKEAMLKTTFHGLRDTERDSRRKDNLLRSQQNDIERLTEITEQYKTEYMQLHDDKLHLRKQCDELRNRLRELEQDEQLVERLTMQSQDLRDDNTRFRADNARLLQILSTIPEYEQFVELYHDYDEEMMFLEGFEGADEDIGGRMAGHPRPATEWRYWVSRDVVKTFSDFHRRVIPNVPKKIFKDLMVLLNDKYRAREKKVEKRLKAEANKQVKELRRQLNHRLPYESIVKAGEYVYLKKQVNDQKRQKQSDSKIGKRQLDKEVHEHYQIERLSKELALLEDDNFKLKNALRDIMQYVESESGDGVSMKTKSIQASSFMHGMQWTRNQFISRITDTIEDVTQRLGRVSLEYQHNTLLVFEKRKNAQQTQLELIRLQNEYLGDVEGVLGEMRGETEQMIGLGGEVNANQVTAEFLNLNLGGEGEKFVKSSAKKAKGKKGKTKKIRKKVKGKKSRQQQHQERLEIESKRPKAKRGFYFGRSGDEFESDSDQGQTRTGGKLVISDFYDSDSDSDFVFDVSITGRQ